MKFGTAVHATLRINYANLGNLLTSNLAPS